MISWPFMLRSKHREVQLENFTLRSALKEANADLRRYKLLVGNLRSGQEEATLQFERVMRTK